MWHQEALPVSVAVLSDTWSRAFSKRLDICIGKYTACIINLGLDHCIAGNCNVHYKSNLWLSMPLGIVQSDFESNSFRNLLSAGYNSFEPFDAVEDTVSSQQSAVQVKVKSHQTLVKISEPDSPLHYYAYATGVTEKTGSPSVRGKLFQAASFCVFL